MNQKQLSNYISENFNLSKNESERILQYILDTIAKDLISNNRVCFHNLGTFKRTLHPTRKFHNIHTGKLETLPAYYTITFKPSKKLVKKLNN